MRNAQDTHKNEIVKFTGSRATTLSDLANLISSLLRLDPPLQVKIVAGEEYVTGNEGEEELLRKWSTTYVGNL